MAKLAEESNRPKKDVSKRQAVEVLPHSYQPSKAELEQDMSINATPNEIAREVMRDVSVREIID